MKLKHRIYLLASTVMFFGTFMALAGGSVAADNSMQDMGMTQQVSIDNFSFGPADLTVKAGTTITWTNKDDVPHNVVSLDKLFASPVLDTDEKFSYTFKNPGAYTYYCSIHPKMTAKVVVK